MDTSVLDVTTSAGVSGRALGRLFKCALEAPLAEMGFGKGGDRMVLGLAFPSSCSFVHSCWQAAVSLCSRSVCCGPCHLGPLSGLCHPSLPLASSKQRDLHPFDLTPKPAVPRAKWTF